MVEDKVAKIRKQSDPCLKMVCKDVAPDENVLDLVQTMWNTMYLHKGFGLAANQIGILKRVIIVHTNGFKLTLINPVIVTRRGRHTAKEACLSFPGKNVIRVRSTQIKVKGLDIDMKPISRKLKGISARCVQHEIDHLNGITLMDDQR
jgi:peptide deformylase